MVISRGSCAFATTCDMATLRPLLPNTVLRGGSAPPHNNTTSNEAWSPILLNMLPEAIQTPYKVTHIKQAVLLAQRGAMHRVPGARNTL